MNAKFPKCRPPLSGHPQSASSPRERGARLDSFCPTGHFKERPIPESRGITGIVNQNKATSQLALCVLFRVNALKLTNYSYHIMIWVVFVWFALSLDTMYGVMCGHPSREPLWHRLTDPLALPSLVRCFRREGWERSERRLTWPEDVCCNHAGTAGGKKWRILNRSQFHSSVGLFEEVLELLDNTMPCVHWTGVSPCLLSSALLYSALLIPPPPPPPPSLRVPR